ncbi:MAG TPA: SDR family oxidoreductase [Chloroflexi bacterium]|nr:SDR family oxidoreductase [Chloroflexota bacterium]
MSTDPGTPAPLALVTGAAVRIGRALAEALSRRGYAIGLHYNRSAAQAEALAEEICAGGGEAVLLQADLRDPDQIAQMFARVDGQPHPLKVLVNSASVMPAGRLLETGVDLWDSTLNLNLRAPWLCAREAAVRMGEGGVIINITDTGWNKTWSSMGAYTISKAGLEALTRLLARELAPGIRVNAVAPGLILKAEDVPDETWEKLVDRLPLKTQGKPEFVAEAVLFLIDHPYITGHTLVVDGGYQLK